VSTRKVTPTFLAFPDTYLGESLRICWPAGYPEEEEEEEEEEEKEKEEFSLLSFRKNFSK
jgi:hypothetical protein